MRAKGGTPYDDPSDYLGRIDYPARTATGRQKRPVLYIRERERINQQSPGFRRFIPFLYFDTKKGCLA
jgi:hypothetical protein